MPLQEVVTASALQSAVRGVRRVCYAGLDSVALRQEVVRRAAPALPADAHVLVLVDPATGLVTDAVGTEASEPLVHDCAEPMHSPDRSDLAHRHGFRSELRGVLAGRRRSWGAWSSLRASGSPPFAERERRFLRAVAPHLARGLQFAILLETSGAADAAGAGEGIASLAPGVLLVDPRGRGTALGATTAALLADLADAGTPPHEGEGMLPLAVGTLAARLRALLATDPAATERAHAGAELRVRGRSGRGYVLRASLLESEDGGTLVVVIDPAERADLARARARH